MRTITEFFASKLKLVEERLPAITEEATKAATEALKAEGKPEEEMAAALPAAIKAAVDAKVTEELKLDGDKLAMTLAAIEAVKGSRGGTLKRVIVMAPSAEGEKGPSGAKEIDGKFYVVEVFSDAARAAPAREERGGRGGRDGKRGGKGGRDGKRGGGRDGGGRGGERGPGRDGGGRGERGPRQDTPPGFVDVSGAPAAGGDATGGRPPRRERKPRAPVEPYTGPNRIVIKGAASAATPSADGNTASESAASTDGNS